MIKSFKCKETEKIFNGIRSKKIPTEIHKKALIKLRSINVVSDLNDLLFPPANH